MAHFWRSTTLLPLLFLSALGLNTAHAQVSLNALQGELDQLKTDSKGNKAKAFTDFMAQMDQAAVDGTAALALIKEAKDGLDQMKADAVKAESQADGTSTDDTPSAPPRRSRRPTAPPSNDATQDQSLPMLAAAHCGLVRFAALYVIHPETPNLDSQWKTWLESVAESYPTLNRTDGLFQTSVSDSVLPKFFTLDLSGKDQSDWKVSKLPDLYEKFVLKPLGDANDPHVLAAWDTLGAMKKVDEDIVTFNNETEPSLYFKKGLADYKLNPSVDKITKLYEAAKLHPEHKEFNQWLDTIAGLIADMRTRYGTQSPVPAASPAPSGPPTSTPPVSL